jgi:hypothetical protein
LLPQVVAELQQRSKQVAFEAAALTSQRQQLAALDAQRRAALRTIEDSLSTAGARLDDRAKEEKLRQIRMAEEAYQVGRNLQRDWLQRFVRAMRGHAPVDAVHSACNAHWSHLPARTLGCTCCTWCVPGCHKLCTLMLLQASLASLRAEWSSELAALKADVEHKRRMAAATLKARQEEEDIKVGHRADLTRKT